MVIKYSILQLFDFGVIRYRVDGIEKNVFIPATLRNCCFVCLARLSLGKVMVFANKFEIKTPQTERQHLPVVVSEITILSPNSQ